MEFWRIDKEASRVQQLYPLPWNGKALLAACWVFIQISWTDILPFHVPRYRELHNLVRCGPNYQEASYLPRFAGSIQRIQVPTIQSYHFEVRWHMRGAAICHHRQHFSSLRPRHVQEPWQPS